MAVNNIFDVPGRVAFVTGALQGLGRRFATTLALNGAKVCLVARNVAKLDRVVDEIREAGGVATSISMDVIDLASINAAVDRTEENFGPISILVNNAGISGQKPFLEQTESDWDSVLDTNLKGAFFVAQAVAKKMSSKGTGTIINVASISAFATISQLTPYAASQGGLVQMTSNMALELAKRGIRVNAIAPGYMETEMTTDFIQSPAGQKMVAGIPMRRAGAQSMEPFC